MSLRPIALREGDRVAVVSPSSPPFPDRLDAGLEALRGWGLEPVVMPHARHVHGHLAGVDRDRAADLQQAFGDPDLRAVFVGRGGYGSTRLSDRLDWSVLRDDPKPLVGFSDVTALLCAAWRRIGLVTIHGPFVSGFARMADEPRAHLRRLLCGTAPIGTVPGRARPVRGGRADGVLLGGNLAMLCSLVGTVDEPDLARAILVVEDVNEAPYRLDRMFTQLRRGGILDGVAGVVVGTLRGCDPPPDRPSATADEVVDERLGMLGVPVVHGLEIGHTARQFALPLGVPSRLDADAGTLEILGAAVQSDDGGS